MSAGTGVMHSEYNASKTEPVHFLQIWLVPDRPGHPPGYEQTRFEPDARRGRLRLVASPDGADGSVTIHQDARIHATLLPRNAEVTHAIAPGRHAWIHVARGSLEVDGTPLAAGDAVAISDASAVKLRGAGDDEAEVLVFDLA
jgi:redox-sensitive bicupin YhaK (pirin superfamily)